MHPMTKAQRAQVAQVFRTAKNNLWDGRGTRPIDASRHIAGAVAYASLFTPGVSQSAAVVAAQLVRARLGGSRSVASWLLDVAKVPLVELTPAAVAEYQQRWLDALVAEMEAE